jgi:hypothetical protein
MPQEVAHRGEGNAAHHQPAGERMPEIVEVEIGQASVLTGCLEGVPDVISE